LAGIPTRENGKTAEDARAEVRRSIQMVEVACGMPGPMLEKVPLTATRAVELLHDAGLPPGVLDLVHGATPAVAAPMAFFPLAGWKNSFFGDLHGHGKDAVAFYTEQKVVMSRWF
jgi:acyl-CoA reductase-like NAD-dependent aldehyde dehydrogenase